MEEENKNKTKEILVFCGVAVIIMFCLGFYVGGIQRPPLYKVYTVNCLVNTNGMLDIIYTTRIAQSIDTPAEALSDVVNKVTINDVDYNASCKFYG